MFRYIALLCGVYLSYRVISRYLRFRRNLATAKRSGIPYVVVPFFYLNRFWLVTHLLWLKILRRLPRKYTDWVDFVLPDNSWELRYSLFEKAGADTFLAVSPSRFALWTCEPAVINQITTRRNDFPKPSSMYKSVNIYGENVVASEGATWRHHRKAVSPPFTEKNNHLVWTESIEQAKAMLASWVGRDGKGNKTVDRIMDDTMRLSLNVISNAAFGKQMQWPKEDSEALIDEGYSDPSKIKNKSDEVDEGHTMSYVYSIHALLDTIIVQFLLPRWMLRYSPFKLLRKSNEAFLEWGKYMSEMLAERKAQWQQKSVKNEGLDILAQLVKGQLAGENVKGAPYLSDSEIMGNMFVLILAGHETAANSIHFALLYLALHIPTQRRLQKDLDTIFQGRPPSEWDYDRDLPALFGGMAGAILAEELRLIPPVIGIPKSTTGVPEQTLIVDGKKCTVPTDAYIPLITAAAHRNPKYWPAGPPSYPGGHPVHPTSNLDNDLEEFRPERWLLSKSPGTATDNTDTDTDRPTNNNTLKPAENLDTEGIGVNLSADTPDTLFRPVRGAYLPFSDGYRSCLGRRFAQVEVLAVLAVLFQSYSVELAVDDVMDHDGEEEKGRAWQGAAEEARDALLWGCATIITLQMRRATVRVRFVRRGEEVFREDVDEWGRRERVRAEGKRGVVGGEGSGERGGDGDGGGKEWRCWDRKGRRRAPGTFK